ncbi:hypothetical protein [Pseudoduganella lutea]|uniref:Secreted protein n=1 Tax=Pseudoduganella lutea TaxID=321985 RepID=A0A4P6L3S8_9BURK|nr:hypothetical protein [Pseudoduganella lutea]QBE66230.1 hypothetical protein EWM63_27315 [Pseudoduganella lutea]
MHARALTAALALLRLMWLRVLCSPAVDGGDVIPTIMPAIKHVGKAFFLGAAEEASQHGASLRQR